MREKVYVHTYICMYVFVCIYIYIYIYIHMLRQFLASLSIAHSQLTFTGYLKPPIADKQSSPTLEKREPAVLNDIVDGGLALTASCT